MPVLVTCKFEKKSDKKQQRKGGDIVFLISQWALSVAIETRVLIQSVPKPYATFPHPNDASYKIWSTLANWLQRYPSFIWIMTEWQNHRIPVGQGKSSKAPTFSKRGYNKLADLSKKTVKITSGSSILIRQHYALIYNFDVWKFVYFFRFF